MVSPYQTRCRPKLARMLRALRLDVEYQSAKGLELRTRDGRSVLDFVGGFGCTLFGHNHAELQQALSDALSRDSAIHVQASDNRRCGELGERLNELLPTETPYLVNFSNSGAEAVEAALKHAYKVFAQAVEVKRVTANDAVESELRRLREQQRLSDPLHAQLSTIQHENDALADELVSRPVILAFSGSFHGKLTSSLKVTSNRAFREDFAPLSSARSIFVDPLSPADLREQVDRETRAFVVPSVCGERVDRHCMSISGVMALVLEVVQGEGGVKALPDGTLHYLAQMHAKVGFPYIVDEVQTGCGRLGAFYGYALTPLVSIDPDYITLSKALGGGLVKIGATLIRQDHYDEDFGVQHTSTFGEDPLAAEVALKVTELVMRDGFELLRCVERIGGELRASLDALRARYPNVVAEVRGRGLMLGLEMARRPHASPLFRATSETGALALFIASYVLYHHGLRLFCPLNSLLAHGSLDTVAVIRIQPGYVLETMHIERLHRALAEVFEIIEANDEYALIGHLVGAPPSHARRTSPRRMVPSLPRAKDTRKPDLVAAFVAHPTSLEMLVDCMFPSMSGEDVDLESFRDWWQSACEFIDPTLVRCEYIRSRSKLVRSDLILVPYLPSHIESLKSAGDLRGLQQKVDDALALAESIADADGVPLASVGLGAYTSIVTDNGRSVGQRNYPVTTGNAYTTALIVEGVERAMERRALQWSRVDLSVVGATGNIGSVLAEIFVQRCPRVRLVGRASTSSLRRLELVRRGCVRSILQAVAFCGEGVADESIRRVSELAGRDDESSGTLRACLRKVRQGRRPSASELDELLELFAEKVGISIELSRDINDVAVSDVVTIATDSTCNDLVTPDMVKTGSIVCCASVPTNLGDAFLDRTEFFAFDGGLARLPERSAVDYPGFPSGGLTYGCHSESIIAGLECGSGFRSVGVLTASDVSVASSLAAKHGFSLGGFRLHNRHLEDGAQT